MNYGREYAASSHEKMGCEWVDGCVRESRQKTLTTKLGRCDHFTNRDETISAVEMGDSQGVSAMGKKGL